MSTTPVHSHYNTIPNTEDKMILEVFWVAKKSVIEFTKRFKIHEKKLKPQDTI